MLTESNIDRYKMVTSRKPLQCSIECKGSENYSDVNMVRHAWKLLLAPEPRCAVTGPSVSFAAASGDKGLHSRTTVSSPDHIREHAASIWVKDFNSLHGWRSLLSVDIAQ